MKATIQSSISNERVSKHSSTPDSERKRRKKRHHKEKIDSRKHSSKAHLQSLTPKYFAGHKDYQGHMLNDRKGISLLKSSSFGSELLLVDGYLWCDACDKTLDFTKTQKIDDHIKGKHHLKHLKKKIDRKKLQVTLSQQIIRAEKTQNAPKTAAPTTAPPETPPAAPTTTAAPKTADATPMPPNPTLPAMERAYVLLVLSDCLKAGIDVSKVAQIAHLFSDKHTPVPNTRSSLQDYFPYLREVEKGKVKTILEAVEYASFQNVIRHRAESFVRRRYALIFDGTPHCGELLGVIARYLDENWEVKQLFIGVRHTDKSVNAVTLGNLISNIVTNPKKGLNISLDECFGMMRDSASLNGSCLDKMSGVLPNSVTVNCVSHCFNRVGQEMLLLKFGDFITPWNLLFSHSGNVLPLLFLIISDLTFPLDRRRFPPIHERCLLSHWHPQSLVLPDAHLSRHSGDF